MNVRAPRGADSSAVAATSSIGKSEQMEEESKPSQPRNWKHYVYRRTHCIRHYRAHTCKFVRASRYAYVCVYICMSIRTRRSRPCRRGIERRRYTCVTWSLGSTQGECSSSNGNSLRPVPQLLQPRRVDVSVAAAAAVSLSSLCFSEKRPGGVERGREETREKKIKGRKEDCCYVYTRV